MIQDSHRPRARWFSTHWQGFSFTVTASGQPNRGSRVLCPGIQLQVRRLQLSQTQQDRARLDYH